MKATTWIFTALTLSIASAAVGLADHHAETRMEEGQGHGEMPPMGPPPEMKQLEPMNGEYSVKFLYRADPASEEWIETRATAVLSPVAGGAAQQLLYEGEMMGMPFTGIGLTAYDRETQQWQTSWVDSMGARITIYTGDFKDGKIVVTGEDRAQGMTYQARLTTHDITDSGFEWLYEMSMDGGATYIEGAKATYTKK